MGARGPNARMVPKNSEHKSIYTCTKMKVHAHTNFPYICLVVWANNGYIERVDVTQLCQKYGEIDKYRRMKILTNKYISGWNSIKEGRMKWFLPLKKTTRIDELTK